MMNSPGTLPQAIRWRMMHVSYMHYVSYGGFMLSLRLDAELESRLAKLADLTGRTKTFYAKEAIQRYLDEMEETYLALSRLEKPGKRLSMADVERELGLDD
jgi:RHH-type rel operon transcriptional repressor/antitoxin RelB